MRETLIKDQALAVSFVSEQGLGNLRYWEGKLQVFQDGVWTTIAEEEVGKVQDIAIEYHWLPSSNGVGAETYTASGAQVEHCGCADFLSVTVTPSNAIDPSVTWSSNNANVTVNATTGEISGNRSGETVTFTATANDGSGTTASFTVTYSSGGICEPCNQDVVIIDPDFPVLEG